jgi:hypothetical protein
LSKHLNGRPDNRRALIADEAARIIQEHGLSDFRSAKEKAVERLGLKSAGKLPGNEEIEKALAERNRVFRSDSQPRRLRQLRESARDVIASLEIYFPRLVGPVLSGHTTEHSGIDLHLFNDSAERVATSLDSLQISHRVAQFRHQFRRGEGERFPGYRFDFHGCDFSVTVFPELRRRIAPLSPVDGKPMQRADVREIERLLQPQATL